MPAPPTGVAREFAPLLQHALNPPLSQSSWTGTLLVDEFRQTKMAFNIYNPLILQNGGQIAHNMTICITLQSCHPNLIEFRKWLPLKTKVHTRKNHIFMIYGHKC